MNFLGKKALLTSTSIVLLGTTFALSPVSLSKTESGVELSAPVAEAAASDWVYVETKKKDTGAQNAMTVATASSLGAILGIAAPWSSPLSAFGVVILDKSLTTAYFKDKIWMRMAGSTFQNKHEITMYSDSSYKKKVGDTITLIENVGAGPRSFVIEEDSNVIEEDSNVIEEDSNVIEEDSNVIEEDSNVIEEDM